MRLDKYLQTSRLVKRRAVATQLCKGGRVQVNGLVAKAGKELAVGNTLSLSFGSRGRVAVEIAEIPTRGVRKHEAANLYRILEDTRTGRGEEDEEEDAG